MDNKERMNCTVLSVRGRVMACFDYANEMKPGRQLTVREVTRQTGALEPNVRFAIYKLLAEGWLTESPHKGAYNAMQFYRAEEITK